MSNVTRIATPLVLVLLAAGLPGRAQQHSKSWVDTDGTRYTLDTQSGLNEVEKNGRMKVVSDASDVKGLCVEIDKQSDLGPNLRPFRTLCENWAELQPKTKIEQVPFSTLIARLVMISPPSSDFGRYRGLELKSDLRSTTYDAAIVPDDLGENIYCTVLETRSSPRHMGYIYQCSMKTDSYPSAIAIKNRLVLLLSSLHLSEDQVTEHGLVMSDKENNECAPTGECTHSQIYRSAETENKVLSIEARPSFVRNARLDVEMLRITGRHNPPDRVASDSGTLEFKVFSTIQDQSTAVTDR
jgi:hypothetical protein